MLTSNYFRTLLLKDLDNKAIPLLSQVSEMPHVYAAPPFNYDDVKHWTIQKEFIPAKKRPAEEIIRNWGEYRVKYTCFTRLLFVYEGAVDVRVGIDSQMAEQLDNDDIERAVGLEALRLPAASAIYFPPGIAYSSESYPFQENNDPQTAAARMLCIEMFDELIVSIIISEAKGVYMTHALQLDDKHLRGMMDRYLHELKTYAAQPSWGGKVLLQKVLLDIIRQIRKQLNAEILLLRNTSWPYFERELVDALSKMSPKNQKLWHHISQYIDTHLDCDLEWETLAKELGISAVHLNRIVQQASGTTTMRYVTKRRISAARSMLKAGTYPIKGIASFVGFRSLRSFSNSFQREMGCSPRAYRKRELNPIPTKKWKFED